MNKKKNAPAVASTRNATLAPRRHPELSSAVLRLTRSKERERDKQEKGKNSFWFHKGKQRNDSEAEKMLAPLLSVPRSSVVRRRKAGSKSATLGRSSGVQKCIPVLRFLARRPFPQAPSMRRTYLSRDVGSNSKSCRNAIGGAQRMKRKKKRPLVCIAFFFFASLCPRSCSGSRRETSVIVSLLGTALSACLRECRV